MNRPDSRGDSAHGTTGTGTQRTGDQTSLRAETGSAERGALQGLRVIELGSLVAGPLATRILGDHGADVVKVESPQRPDALRTWGQAEYEGCRLWWTLHARNKRCVTLDLRRVEGQDILCRMIADADVVVENFRPGTLERWNLGWERLSEINPRLVLARVSGYGQTGPYAQRPGYASVAEAASGLRSINGYPDRPPVRMSISLGDSLGGMMAAQGVMAALIARQSTGRGQVVDVALTESCLALTESMVPEYLMSGFVRQPSGTKLPGIAPSNVYLTEDDRWLVIAANQDTLFARLCTAMDQSELATDSRFSDHVTRGRHQDELDEIIGEWVRSKSSAEVQKLLDSVGVVVGPVHTVADVVEDPQFLDRQAFVGHSDDRLDRDVVGPGVFPVLSDTPGSVRWGGPSLPGSHNSEVYSELGFDEATIDRLRDCGVV